jgi:hypothetical protein
MTQDVIPPPMTEEQVTGDQQYGQPEVEQPQAAQQADYFGFSDTRRFTFPDKISFIEFSVMNEGMKADYQKRTNKDMILERQSGNARMKVDIGGDRWALIKASVTGWNLMRQGVSYPFTDNHLKEWLENANPRLVEDLEKEIRKANPWLLAEMSVADIEREIENLEEMKKVAQEREAGEAS